MIYSLLKICKILLSVCSRSNKNLLELLLTGTCRDRVSADNVLLKTLESIDTTSDSCIAEYLCSLLELCSRDEAVGLEGCSCDTLEDLACCCWLSLTENHHLESLTLE